MYFFWSNLIGSTITLFLLPVFESMKIQDQREQQVNHQKLFIVIAATIGCLILLILSREWIVILNRGIAAMFIAMFTAVLVASEIMGAMDSKVLIFCTLLIGPLVVPCFIIGLLRLRVPQQTKLPISFIPFIIRYLYIAMIGTIVLAPIIPL